MKVIFSKKNFKDERGKAHAMGTSSAAFETAELSHSDETIIKLTYYLFHNLDRQMITALEKSLSQNRIHRKNIRSLIGQVAEQRMVLSDILKPVMRRSHRDRYAVFERLCDIASRCQKYEMGFLRRLLSIGKKLELADDEIYRCVETKGLAE